MVICLERGADLHMAQLMPLPLTISCFSKIKIGFTFLVPAHTGSPQKGSLNGCVCLGWPRSPKSKRMDSWNGFYMTKFIHQKVVQVQKYNTQSIHYTLENQNIKNKNLKNYVLVCCSTNSANAALLHRYASPSCSIMLNFWQTIWNRQSYPTVGLKGRNKLKSWHLTKQTITCYLFWSCLTQHLFAHENPEWFYHSGTGLCRLTCKRGR